MYSSFLLSYYQNILHSYVMYVFYDMHIALVETFYSTLGRSVPEVSQKDSIANKFLLKKMRNPQLIKVSSNPLWESRLAGMSFESWSDWLEPLSGRVTTLVRTLDAGDALHSVSSSYEPGSRQKGVNTTFPAAVVIAEFEQMISVLHICASDSSSSIPCLRLDIVHDSYWKSVLVMDVQSSFIVAYLRTLWTPAIMTSA